MVMTVISEVTPMVRPSRVRKERRRFSSICRRAAVKRSQASTRCFIVPYTPPPQRGLDPGTAPAYGIIASAMIIPCFAPPEGGLLLLAHPVPVPAGFSWRGCRRGCPGLWPPPCCCWPARWRECCCGTAGSRRPRRSGADRGPLPGDPSRTAGCGLRPGPGRHLLRQPEGPGVAGFQGSGAGPRGGRSAPCSNWAEGRCRRCPE